MLSYRIVACAFGAALMLSTHVASAAQLSRKAVVPDEGGHRTRREHVAYCERSKTTCQANYNPLSARSHERAHCEITFNQCMNRWGD